MSLSIKFVLMKNEIPFETNVYIVCAQHIIVNNDYIDKIHFRKLRFTILLIHCLTAVSHD